MTDKPDRRSFLKLAAGLGGLLVGVLTAVPAFRAFAWPAFRRRRGGTWIKLGEADLFEAKVPVKIDFVDTVTDAWVETRALRNVWLYTEDGANFIVYSGRCTHLGCSYGYDQQAGVFVCPCHNGKFDVKTGTVLGGPPPRPLDRLDVKVEGGLLYAEFRNFRLGVPDKVAV